jgi:hypothetical protein
MLAYNAGLVLAPVQTEAGKEMRIIDSEYFYYVIISPCCRFVKLRLRP